MKESHNLAQFADQRYIDDEVCTEQLDGCHACTEALNEQQTRVITMQKHMNLVAVGEDNAVIQLNAIII